MPSLRAWVVTGVVLLGLTTGRPAEARVAVADCYAEPDLRVEATALSLVVRSILGGKDQLDWTALVKTLGGEPEPVGFYADAHQAKALLQALPADHLLTWACSSNGVDLVATVRLTGADGKTVATATIQGWRGDLPQIAQAIGEQMGKPLQLVPDPSMIASYGSLQPYVRAGRALLRDDRQTALANLLGADPAVARRLPAVARLGKSIWESAALSASDRVLAALITASPEEILALVEQLGPGLPSEEAAAARALALLAASKTDEAEQALSVFMTDISPLVLLARARLADRKNQAPAREAALTPLIVSRNLPGLRFVASLPAGKLGVGLEAGVLTAASAIRARDPALASALALRALEADPNGPGMELIATELVAEGKEKALIEVLGKAPLTSVTWRIKAQLRLRSNDVEGAAKDVDAALASALAEGAPADPELALVRARLLTMKGDHLPASQQYELAGKTQMAARYELARSYDAMKDDERARAARLALADDKSSSEALRARAVQLGQEKKTAEAVRLLEDLRAKASEHPLTQEALAQQYRLAGDPDQARVLDLEVEEARKTTIKLKARDLELGDSNYVGGLDAGPVKPQKVEAVRTATVEKKRDYTTYVLIAAGVGALVGLALLGRVLAPLLVGGGELQVVLHPDPEATDRVYNTRVTKIPRGPKVSGDPGKWAASTVKSGVKIGNRGQTLISNVTRFDVFPGQWFVHVWGVHKKGGELVVLPTITQPITVVKGETVVANMNLRPSLSACQVLVTTDDGPAIGAMVWMNDDDKRQSTDGEGRAVFFVGAGAHVLRVQVGARTIEKPVKAPGGGQVEVAIKL